MTQQVDALKGIAEIIDHVLYEILALFIPGATMALTTAWLLGPDTWNAAVALTTAQPWIAGVAAYLLGYVVQGFSRPVVAVLEWILQRPARLLRWVIQRWLPGVWERLARRGDDLEGMLKRRHAHQKAPATAGRPVDLAVLARERWEKRLGVPEEHALSADQVRNLSYSELLPQRARLERFRTAASLTRGVATVVAVAFALVCVQFVSGDRALGRQAVLLVQGLVVAFYGLLERADMYDRMWNAVIPPQFLAASTHPQPQPDPPR